MSAYELTVKEKEMQKSILESNNVGVVGVLDKENKFSLYSTVGVYKIYKKPEVVCIFHDEIAFLSKKIMFLYLDKFCIKADEKIKYFHPYLLKDLMDRKNDEDHPFWDCNFQMILSPISPLTLAKHLIPCVRFYEKNCENPLLMANQLIISSPYGHWPWEYNLKKLQQKLMDYIDVDYEKYKNAIESQDVGFFMDNVAKSWFDELPKRGIFNEV